MPWHKSREGKVTGSLGKAASKRLVWNYLATFTWVIILPITGFNEASNGRWTYQTFQLSPHLRGLQLCSSTFLSGCGFGEHWTQSQVHSCASWHPYNLPSWLGWQQTTVFHASDSQQVRLSFPLQPVQDVVIRPHQMKMLYLKKKKQNQRGQLNNAAGPNKTNSATKLICIHNLWIPPTQEHFLTRPHSKCTIDSLFYWHLVLVA